LDLADSGCFQLKAGQPGLMAILARGLTGGGEGGVKLSTVQ
jgi:hypothetical protein